MSTPRQPLGVENLDRTTPKDEKAIRGRFAQRAVSRRSCRARQPSQLLLGDRQRHTLLPKGRDRQEPPKYPGLRRYEEHLHEKV